MTVGMAPRLLVLAAALALAASAQYVPPGPQETGCPLRAVDGRIQTLSPQGQATIDAKGELVVAQLTDETRYQLPGRSGKAIKKGLQMQLPVGTRAKFRICERNGEVYDLKIIEEKLGKKE